MSHLILSHLSHNNNKPEIVLELFSKHAGGTSVIIASRHKESEVFSIDGTWKMIGNKPPRRQPGRPKQLSLF